MEESQELNMLPIPQNIENHSSGYDQEESMDIDEACHLATEPRTSLLPRAQPVFASPVLKQLKTMAGDEICRECCFEGLLSKRAATLAKGLNVVMSHLHQADWEEHVAFEVLVTVRKFGSLVVQEWKPVTDPTDRDRCPEAFDGYEVLLHMHKYSCAYAQFLHLNDKKLRQQIEEMLRSFPTAGMPPPDKKHVIEILQMSSRFLEWIEASLHRINEEELAEKVGVGVEEINQLEQCGQGLL